MRHTRNSLARAGVTLLAAGWAFATAMAQQLEPVPPEQADQLAALIGPRLTAQPVKARAILVFWRCEGFVHGKGIGVHRREKVRRDIGIEQALLFTEIMQHHLENRREILG